MFVKKDAQLDEEDYFRILSNFQNEFEVSDIDVDLVYLIIIKGLTRKEAAKEIYREYKPEVDLRTITEERAKGLADKHLKRPHVKQYIKAVQKKVQEEIIESNMILSQLQRRAILSQIADGVMTEEAKSKYSGIYQKKADLRTRIEAIKVLNEYDLKLKEQLDQNEIVINVVSSINNMDDFKTNINKKAHPNLDYESNNKIKSDNQYADIEDVMGDE